MEVMLLKFNMGTKSHIDVSTVCVFVCLIFADHAWVISDHPSKSLLSQVEAGWKLN